MLEAIVSNIAIDINFLNLITFYYEMIKSKALQLYKGYIFIGLSIVNIKKKNMNSGKKD